ncbi:WW domain-containing adapter protein with coiled-coil isoform X4 [Erinaceus europaeus]|uniref:WW domain-containing adapter protein with coiled-coil isoform X4 n=1 Tax=Erinaceus europaeus TaxID=9365 RepID=A0ABM3XI71_ERIEU|nr:WW domain-containing adapter protein with coiled-coil isoform X4 [Erinaceus europaeus]
MRRCATPQTRRPQTRCCGAPTAPRASTATQAPPRPGTCMCTGSETGKGGPVTLHKKIHTTTVLFIVQIHILLIQAIIQAKLQMHLMILQMTGLNISALLGKNTTTIAEQKSHSGKNQKSGLKVEDKHSSDASSLLPQNILSQTSRHNDRDYRLPRAETHSSSTPVQHPIKPVVHPTATPSTVPSSPFTLQSDHQPKKSFDANGASTLSKLPTPTSSVPAQKTERKALLSFYLESTTGDKSVPHSCTTPSTSSASGLNPTSAPPASASAIPVSPVPQSPIPPLLQDPNLLRQLLPALQATLQLNNSNMDISKINEVLTAAVTQASLQSIIHKFFTAGPSAFNITSLISQAAQLSTQAQPSNQSPMSLTSDASSPRSYVSPRISTPQTNTVPIKPLISTPPVSSQPKVSTPVVKQGPVSQSATQQPAPADKQQGHEPVSPRSLQRSNSQRSPSPGPNHTPSSNVSVATVVPQNSSARPPCSLTPTLAAHFNENLIKHVQGWPADHAEKQASRLREEAHNMGSVHMSEICTELKNLRSLVRVCEIQATLREQRILFLRQQIKELEKLKNQNSFMV